MKQFPLFLLSLCCLIGCTRGSSSEKAPDGLLAEAAQSKEIVALGRLKPESGIISVGATPGDRIQSLDVEIGSEVDKNQPLMVLASHEMRRQELRLAEAQLADAKKQIDLKKSAAADQLDIAKASRSSQDAFQKERDAILELISVQKKQVDLARNQLDQLSRLFDSESNRNRDLVTEDDLAKAKLALAQAEAELRKATSDLTLAEEKQRINNAVTESNIQVAQNQAASVSDSPLEALQSAVKLAKMNLERATVRSPIAGTVVNLFNRQGDMITNQPVLRLANLNRMICVAEVYESQLALIDDKTELSAEITSAALIDPKTRKPMTLTGTVYRKSQLVGQATLVDPNPLAPQDRRTAEVYIRLDNNSAQIASNYINLQVRVRIVLPDSGG